MSGVKRVSMLALLGLALGFGLLWGLRSQPLTDTEIIDAAASVYVAETGGARTDCAARPADLPDVRLVVTCADGRWVAAYDRHGRVVEVGRAFPDGEPRT
jgi:hypothetical protein